MRLAVAGGGPGGLLFAILARRADPAAEVTVLERNGPDDTFGFGVVFSDETLANLRSADPPVFARIEAEFRSWTNIDIHHGDRLLRSGGHGFAAISRHRLLRILADRAREVGATVHHRRPVDGLADPALAGADLVVAADGVNSALRAERADRFGPTLDRGDARFVWLGTTKVFDQFTFLFAETEHGIVQAHCYPYDDRTSTFIVETDPATWRRAGLAESAGVERPPGESDPEALAFAEKVFGQHLDGHAVLGNHSRWLRFTTVTNERWHDGNVVLLGDAAHTAHFSVGSGTKLAMEDAIALSAAVAAHRGDVPAALAAYETERKPAVASLQRAAATSAAWFESVRRYWHLDSEQFAFQLLTRSQRITYDNLRLRDPAFVDGLLHWFWRSTPASRRPPDPATPPMFHPFDLRGLRLPNRVVVSPMAQYCAVDGMPNDWHLVHLGSRAVGGAAMVMTEMTCVSPTGRISPGCTGLWDEAQRDEWARIVEFVHRWTPSRIGLQLGHSGRKGSTKRMWEGEDEPLDDGNWPLISASPIRYKPFNQVPREMTRADMDEVRDQFVRSARFGAEAGFDLLELHAAHGYLLSSFVSPVANRRTDGYGGSLANRMRWPLEVVDAVRAVWPDDRPLSVRISAVDWVEGGTTADDAVEVAAMLAAHGVDAVDVSTGQVHPDQQPRYGRLYQTPFADRIAHEVDVAVMTVGAVSSVDDVNTIVLAGRADLCLLARPHLVDPYWTLNAAIDQGWTGHPWPPQYLSGRTARRREQSAVPPVPRDPR
ncbi:MAG TPA: bifunctional salicylyl-CoA 5-hydroxylase/oxidoreductase [Acidimicrobiales bacterium]|jgi:anthraniloyl-CoA monooxygenase